MPSSEASYMDDLDIKIRDKSGLVQSHDKVLPRLDCRATSDYYWSEEPSSMLSTEKEGTFLLEYKSSRSDVVTELNDVEVDFCEMSCNIFEQQRKTFCDNVQHNVWKSKGYQVKDDGTPLEGCQVIDDGTPLEGYQIKYDSRGFEGKKCQEKDGVTQLEECHIKHDGTGFEGKKEGTKCQAEDDGTQLERYQMRYQMNYDGTPFEGCQMKYNVTGFEGKEECNGCQARDHGTPLERYQMDDDGKPLDLEGCQVNDDGAEFEGQGKDIGCHMVEDNEGRKKAVSVDVACDSYKAQDRIIEQKFRGICWRPWFTPTFVQSHSMISCCLFIILGLAIKAGGTECEIKRPSVKFGSLERLPSLGCSKENNWHYRAPDGRDESICLAMECRDKNYKMVKFQDDSCCLIFNVTEKTAGCYDNFEFQTINSKSFEVTLSASAADKMLTTLNTRTPQRPWSDSDIRSKQTVGQETSDFSSSPDESCLITSRCGSRREDLSTSVYSSEHPNF